MKLTELLYRCVSNEPYKVLAIVALVVFLTRALEGTST